MCTVRWKDDVSAKMWVDSSCDMWCSWNFLSLKWQLSHLFPYCKSNDNLIKKENEIFLVYWEIQMGSVTKSYMRKGFIIYEENFFLFFFIRESWVCYRLPRPAWEVVPFPPLFKDIGDTSQFQTLDLLVTSSLLFKNPMTFVLNCMILGLVSFSDSHL